MYSSAKYLLCMFFSWKMTGKLWICYLIYDLCSKLQLLSIWYTFLRQRPPYISSLHQMNPSETCHSSLKDFSKFGSLHWREALAGDNHGVADQKQSAMGRQSGGGCLAHVCNLFTLTKVQPVLQHCKLASYCEAKATNLKTANHHSMWTI